MTTTKTAPSAADKTAQQAQLAADKAVETKPCTGCGQNLPVGEFAYKNKETGKRSARCRTCVSAYFRGTYYPHARGDLIPAAHARVVSQRADLREVRASFLAAKTCAACGTGGPLANLQVRPPHELTGGKSVADIIRNGWSADRFTALLTAAEAAGGILCRHCMGAATARIPSVG